MFSSKAVAQLLFLGGVLLPCGSAEPMAEVDLIITEIADPNSEATARYVELYSATLADQTITTPDLFLARWTNGNTDPTAGTAIALTGKTVGSDGFLIFCPNDTVFQSFYSTTCDVAVGSGGPADSNGDDQIAILQGDPSATFEIVDIFGVPGEDGSGTDHEFEDGRAERKGTAAARSPKAVWDVADWNVFSDAPGSATKEVDDMDPRAWIGKVSPTTEPPTESTAPSTSLVPSESPTPIPKVSIQDIQGDSNKSPLEDVRVLVEVAFVTRVVYNGFFMQEEPQEGVMSSSGIFVFTSNEPSDLQEGNAVQVEGTVEEFFGQTQLGNFAGVTRLEEEEDVQFDPVKLVLPLADKTDFERYEGMLVDVGGQQDYEIYISEYFNFDRYGEILVCAAPEENGRIFQFTARNPPSVEGYAEHIDEIARSCVKIDDNDGTQNPDPAKLGGIYPIVDTVTNNFRGGAEIKKLIGPLWFSFDDWRVATLTEDDFDYDNKPNERLAAPEVKGADTIIAVANVLNYFVTLRARGADTEAEFERQANKVVTALTEMNADIFGLVEVENSPDNGAMSNLVTRLNIATGRQYASASDGPIGSDAIRVAVVYDTEEYDLLDIATLDDTNSILSDLLQNSESGGIFNSNRVPLAATFSHKKDGATLRLIVNHFKSKGDFSRTASGLDKDMQDGAGNFNNQRSLAARALLLWTKELQSSLPTDYEMLLGDFNAYEKEDPIEIIKAEGYTSLVGLEEDEQIYGYLFDGQFGALDYAFIRDAEECNAAAVEWRGVNSDEPDIYDYNLNFGRDTKIYDATTPIRYSDHDPIVIGLNLKGGKCDKPEVKEGKKMKSGKRGKRSRKK